MYRQITIVLFLIETMAIMNFQSIGAAEVKPMIEYSIFGNGHPLRIRELNWATEDKLYIDSSTTPGRYFTREVGWQKYDPVNNRIFFEETLVAVPHHYHIFDLNTKQVTDLPFEDYIEYSENILITPGSKYVIYSYGLPPPDTGGFSKNLLKTVVLDGKTLNLVGERDAMSIVMSVRPSVWSYVSDDNNLLFNIEYLQKNAPVKSHAIVTYTLPDLNSIDTTFLDDLGWNGPKIVRDVSGSKLLIKGWNGDDPSLPQGGYMILWDGSTGKIATPFISENTSGEQICMITPAGDEIVLIGKATGVVKRYSIPDGNFLGETNVSHAIWGAFFRSDGNLYLRQADVRGEAVVDYKNNRLIRTITLPAID